jgi:hypothetical protein
MPRAISLPQTIRRIQGEIEKHERASQRLRRELDEALGLLSGRALKSQALTTPRAMSSTATVSSPSVSVQREISLGAVLAERKRPIRKESSVGWAVTLLREAGQPIESEALTASVNERGNLKISKATLVSSLARYVRANDTFTRPRPGYYGLKEFGARGDLLESA